MIIRIRNSYVVGACVVAVAVVAGSLVTAQPTKEIKPTVPAKPSAIQPDVKPTAPSIPDQPEMQLPPGWTTEDLQACMAAGTPGNMHEHLAKGAGTWQGQTTMWMGPGMEPMPKSACTSVVTVVMDGRYAKCEMSGEIPGMGQFNGLGYSGFDNVSQKFVGNWLDNHSTGIMNGTGELSKDGKSMTWTYTYNCPVTKKQAVMRQVETYTSPTTMTLDMFMNDPKSGKEYKGMHIEFTKK